jgi:hypothetical protein
MSQNAYDTSIGFLVAFVLIPSAWVALWVVVVAVKKWRDKS